MNKRIQHQLPEHQRQLPYAFITSRRCLIAAWIFFALMVAIGAIPGDAKALSDMVGDKLLHFCAYALLSCLIYGGLVGSPASRALRTLLLIALLGGLDETIQIFMPYRVAGMDDWAFDLLAASVSMTALGLLGPVLTRWRMDRHSILQKAARLNEPVN